MLAFSRDLYEIIHNVVGLKISEIFCENVCSCIKVIFAKESIHFILFLMPNLFI